MTDYHEDETNYVNCDPNIPHSHSLLCLPDSIRHEIYECLESEGAPDVIKHLSCQFDIRGYPHNLLFTCRRIYEELTPIAYSRRDFLSYYKTFSLSSLQNLNALGMRHMRDLTVVLYQEICHHAVSCMKDQHHPFDMCNKSRIPPGPGISMVQGRTVFEEWRQASEKLSAFITPGQLRLKLLCDAADFMTGQEVVASLMKLPVLKDCTIRLGSPDTPGLGELARLSRLQAKGVVSKHVKHVKTSFRYNDLPNEIKLMVLDNTDLVPRSRQICWNPTRKYYTRDSIDCLHHPLYRGSFTCFCTTNHASAAPVSCECWEAPRALWQVSRGFREDALRVFFSNKIIITPDECLHTRYVIPGDTEMYSFLCRGVPVGGLKYIRSLHYIAGVDHACQYFGPELPRYHNLVRIWRMTRGCWHPMGLTLSVYIPTWRRYYPGNFDNTEDLFELYSEYNNLFEALSIRNNRNMVRLFAYLIFPQERDVPISPLTSTLLYAEYGGEAWHTMEQGWEHQAMGYYYRSRQCGKWPSSVGWLTDRLDLQAGLWKDIPIRYFNVLNSHSLWLGIRHWFGSTLRDTYLDIQTHHIISDRTLIIRFQILYCW